VRKEEFIRAANRFNRRATAIFIIPLLVALAFIVAYGPFQRRFEACLAAKVHGPIPGILQALPVGVPLAVAIGAIIMLTRRNDRDMGIACPHCGQPLAQLKAIVIASKNCPYCGKKVLDDI
jgi:DNA-directed RNA polymerase subunit RPC12/RpoP